MKICYLCNEYPPCQVFGGIGIFVQTLARALVQAGHHVTVVGLYNIEEECQEDNDQGVRIIRLSARARSLKMGWLINRRRMLACVENLIRTEGIDIVESPDYEGLLWLAPKWTVPKVVRIHGGEVYFRRLLGEPLKRKHWISESQSIRQADALASVTHYAWLQTQRIFNLKDSVVAILPNPVDCSVFVPGLPEQVVSGRIVNSGTFIRKKGVLDLFAALPSVFEQCADAHLICIGGDSRDAQTGRTSTQQLALESLPKQFHKRVTFTGRVPHSQMLEYLQTAQVCAYPSHLETQGIVWVEAMACGKPLVASSTATGPEVVDDQVSGLLCDPSDHARMAELLLCLLKDAGLASRLGAEARRQAMERFSLDALLPRNIAWYRQVSAKR